MIEILLPTILLVTFAVYMLLINFEPVPFYDLKQYKKDLIEYNFFGLLSNANQCLSNKKILNP